MSLARTGTVAFAGVTAVPVEVQVQLAPGLPAFTIVGLPAKAVTESRERVRAALATLGIALPPKRLLVNLAPADLAKDGSHFDLPIALAILAALAQVPAEAVAGCCAMGELALDGRIESVPGILPAALAAADAGRVMICPAAQGGDAAWAGAQGVIAAPDLRALIAHLRGVALLPPPRLPEPAEQPPPPDLADLRGHATARRVLEIAAAGRHNLLLIGPPGSGKSMLATRLPGLLPPLGPAEALEVSVVQSLSGLLAGGRIPSRRPFRAPHHSASQAALIGGGSRIRPGEVSLAHRGVLFLDELPEFPRPALEALREPLESGEVVISRAGGRAAFPARFQLVAAMNPCPCGMLGITGRECGRAPLCGNDYRAKISGPLLDRIDLVIEMTPIPARELVRAPPGEPTAMVAARVAAAVAFAARRGGGVNAEAPLEELRASAEGDALALVEQAADRLGLSNRGVLRALRVARTIADLAGSPKIGRTHLAEALAYRPRDFRIPG
jgi:magnesium chelatase family protein